MISIGTDTAQDISQPLTTQYLTSRILTKLTNKYFGENLHKNK